jgi:hypothetical protein
MLVVNKKVNEAIRKLENFDKDLYDLRTDNVKPDKFKGKYILYKVTLLGNRYPQVYGYPIMSFKTQKEFIDKVNEMVSGANL